jgi:hypothetical protein
MSSQASTPLELDSTTSQTSAVASGSTLPSVFSHMMQNSGPTALLPVRDRCFRPTPQYNDKYNLYEPLAVDREETYSSYV